MAVGFVLITTEPGQEVRVREMVAQVECVKGIWVVFGNFDCFVKVEADEESELTESHRPRNQVSSRHRRN